MTEITNEDLPSHHPNMLWEYYQIIYNILDYVLNNVLKFFFFFFYQIPILKILKKKEYNSIDNLIIFSSNEFHTIKA